MLLSHRPLKGDFWKNSTNNKSSPFKGDRRGSKSSPFKGDTRGASKGDREGSSSPKWHTADVLDYGLLKEDAKANRIKQTEAESVFWNIVKSNGLGQKCRRQYIIGQYIVDFFFRQSLLIVEIDGGYHFTGQQQREDAIRQDWLEHMGYKLLRFTNEEVLFDTDEVIEKMKLNLNPS